MVTPGDLYAQSEDALADDDSPWKRSQSYEPTSHHLPHRNPSQTRTSRSFARPSHRNPHLTHRGSRAAFRSPIRSRHRDRHRLNPIAGASATDQNMQRLIVSTTAAGLACPSTSIVCLRKRLAVSSENFRFSDGLVLGWNLFALVKLDKRPAFRRVRSVGPARWPHLGPHKVTRYTPTGFCVSVTAGVCA